MSFLVIYNILSVQARVKSINICYKINKEIRLLFAKKKCLNINKCIWKLIEATSFVSLHFKARHFIHIKVVKFMVKILPIWFSTMWSYCLSSYFRWFMIHVFILYDVHAFGIQSSRKMCCCSFTNNLIYSLPTIKKCF